MNPAPALVPVPFHGDTLFIVPVNDEPYTPMKPIVEGMGLDWRGQRVKLRGSRGKGVSIIETPSPEGGLNRDHLHSAPQRGGDHLPSFPQRDGDHLHTFPQRDGDHLPSAPHLNCHDDNSARWRVEVVSIPTPGGPQEVLCIPVRKLPAWLASINPKKVRPDLRERVILYQEECDNALWDYWTKGRAERPTAHVPPQWSGASELSTVHERAGLRAAMRDYAQACAADAGRKPTSNDYAIARKEILDHFNLPGMKAMTFDQIPAAMQFLQARTQRLGRQKLRQSPSQDPTIAQVLLSLRGDVLTLKNEVAAIKATRGGAA